MRTKSPLVEGFTFFITFEKQQLPNLFYIMKNLRLILDVHKPTIIIANFAFDMTLVVPLKTAVTNRITPAVHRHSFITLPLGQEIGKIKTPLDDFYKTESSTIQADLGCIVEQNKNITEINTPKGVHTH